ncbi:MAG: aldo/keto reductase, partial [Hyphomonadaceae bacterium]|nr:aldo/keto reductase [Hyphomonadaceae bacterium]
MIPLRPLGATGLLISPLGFGVSGAHGAGITPERQTHALVEAAYRSGVRLFDTAPFYGLAQARLGRALAALGAGREAVVISKAGTVRRGGRLLKDFSPNG